MSIFFSNKARVFVKENIVGLAGLSTSIGTFLYGQYYQTQIAVSSLSLVDGSYATSSVSLASIALAFIVIITIYLIWRSRK